MPNNKKQPKLNRTQAAKLRVKELRRLLPGGELGEGNHDAIGGTPDGVCLMEAVAWVAGEPHSDHPKCACPVLTDIGININDRTDDAGRQRLIPAIPALIGSKSGSKRTYFKRAKLGAERGLAATLGAIDFDDVRSGTKDTIDDLVLDFLESAKGRPLTKALARMIVDSFKYFDTRPYNPLSSFDAEQTVEMLEKLHTHWDTTGITYSAYCDILEDTDFTSIIPDRDLPGFFVDLATTHA
jgi:hypothetical protein